MTKYLILNFSAGGNLEPIDRINADSQQEAVEKWAEKQVEKLLEKYDKDEITVYTVHAVSGWTKTDKRRFDSWSLLKETNETGEEELMHRDPGGNGAKPGKQAVKDEARKLARENKPAIVLIEDRNFKVHRKEVAE
jgi:hypothetical protein